jgi:hypothetical protein
MDDERQQREIQAIEKLIKAVAMRAAGCNNELDKAIKEVESTNLRYIPPLVDCQRRDETIKKLKAGDQRMWIMFLALAQEWDTGEEIYQISPFKDKILFSVGGNQVEIDSQIARVLLDRITAGKTINPFKNVIIAVDKADFEKLLDESTVIKI